MTDSLWLPDTQDGTELSQGSVIKNLVPAVKKQWKELMEAVKARTISIQHLQKTFATLGSEVRSSFPLVSSLLFAASVAIRSECRRPAFSACAGALIA